MRRELIIVVALVMVTASSGIIQSAMAKKGDSGSYSAGYSHGCDDAKLPVNDRYLVQPGKGASFHSSIFNTGYSDGFAACSGQSSPSNTNVGPSSSSSSSSSSTSNGNTVNIHIDK